MQNEKQKADLLPGTLDMLVLKTLTRGHLHGYAIAQTDSAAVRRYFADRRRVFISGPPASRTERLDRGGWGISANNRRARFYTLTPAGRKQLNAEKTRYSQVIGAIGRVMGTV